MFRIFPFRCMLLLRGNSGLAAVFFNLSGKVTSLNDWFIIKVSSGTKSGARLENRVDGSSAMPKLLRRHFPKTLIMLVDM